MTRENSNSLTLLHVLLGYLAVATLTVTLWMSWLSQENTSTPIGLSLVRTVLLMATFVLGVVVLTLDSLRISRNDSASSGQKNILAVSTYCAAILILLAFVATGWKLITGPTEGFFEAGLGNAVPATLWGLSIVALWICLLSVTGIIRKSEKSIHKT